MVASPGSGKSHFIKQLATAMVKESLQAITFNMAAMQSLGDMAGSIDEARNVKINDKYPILFLDEFDSDPKNYELLLPLLWDGELQIGHRDLKLGKAIIILAGSKPTVRAAMMRPTEAMNEERDDKLVDLLSRINGGVINIPDLDSRDRDRRPDKVCIATVLLKARFGNDLERVSRSLLSFIAHTHFRHGIRSITHLIDIIPIERLVGKELKVCENDLAVGIEHSLTFHLLDTNDDVVRKWKDFAIDDKTVNLIPPNDSMRRNYQDWASVGQSPGG